MKYIQDTDLTLYQGDVLEVLKTLPAESVHCVVTSPPYWGLRDYGTGSWVGGDPDCDHTPPKREHGVYKNGQGQAYQSSNTNWDAPHKSYGQECGKCGARRVDNQLGLEPTPEQYLDSMVAVFREVRRVLRSDGSCWVNMGDSYASSPAGNTDATFSAKQASNHGSEVRRTRDNSRVPGLKPKDLCMIPARLALALQQPYYTGNIKDEKDRIWLAAMVDAEGCMFIHKRKVGQSNGQGYERKTDSYGAGLEVTSTDRVIVERCLEITGLGSVCEQTPKQNDRRKQTLYRWNLRSNVCREVIRELYPHLVAKQHEARLVLGCPSSGEDADKAHRSLKAIHQGESPCIDFDPPTSLYERGWFVRSGIIWAKPQPDA